MFFHFCNESNTVTFFNDIGAAHNEIDYVFKSLIINEDLNRYTNLKIKDEETYIEPENESLFEVNSFKRFLLLDKKDDQYLFNKYKSYDLIIKDFKNFNYNPDVCLSIKKSAVISTNLLIKDLNIRIFKKSKIHKNLNTDYLIQKGRLDVAQVVELIEENKIIFYYFITMIYNYISLSGMSNNFFSKITINTKDYKKLKYILEYITNNINFVSRRTFKKVFHENVDKTKLNNLLESKTSLLNYSFDIFADDTEFAKEKKKEFIKRMNFNNNILNVIDDFEKFKILIHNFSDSLCTSMIRTKYKDEDHFTIETYYLKTTLDDKGNMYSRKYSRDSPSSNAISIFSLNYNKLIYYNNNLIIPDKVFNDFANNINKINYYSKDKTILIQEIIEKYNINPDVNVIIYNTITDSKYKTIIVRNGKFNRLQINTIYKLKYNMAISESTLLKSKDVSLESINNIINKNIKDIKDSLDIINQLNLNEEIAYKLLYYITNIKFTYISKDTIYHILDIINNYINNKNLELEPKIEEILENISKNKQIFRDIIDADTIPAFKYLVKDQIKRDTLRINNDLLRAGFIINDDFESNVYMKTLDVF